MTGPAWAEDDQPGRRLLVESARLRTYPDGSTVVHQGDPSPTLYVIQSGRVLVRVVTVRGEDLILAVLGPGDVFGELGPVAPSQERTASVVAVGALTAHVVSSDTVLALRQKHPEVSDYLLRVLGSRLQQANDLRAQTHFLTAHQVISKRLLDVAEIFVDQPGADRVLVPLSQAQLGQLSGIGRPTVNGALRRLAERGLVETGRNAVHVTSLRELRQYCSRWDQV